MAGLDKSFLYKIMKRVGEIESDPPNLAHSVDFLDLTGKTLEQAELKDMLYIDRHLVFLEQCGFLSLGTSTLDCRRGVRLTHLGHMFLQPELSNFGNESLLPDIIRELEQCIHTLTYPEEEKNGLLYKMREAFAKQRGELVVKAVIEIASQIVKAHGL
jgi:hypothetical protein